MAEPSTPPTPHAHGKIAEFLTKDIGGIPVWAWGLIGVAGVGIGYLFVHNAGGFSGLLGGGAASTSSPASALSQQGPTPNPQPGPQGPPGPSGPSGPGGQIGTIRAKDTTPGTPNYSWDQSHSGVPIRNSAGGSGAILGYAGFGTTITILGNGPVTGQPAGSGRSDTWWQVPGGYISTDDVASTGSSGMNPPS